MPVNGEVIYTNVPICAYAHSHTHTDIHILLPTLPDLPVVWRVRFSSGYGIKLNLTFLC